MVGAGAAAAGSGAASVSAGAAASRAVGEVARAAAGVGSGAAGETAGAAPVWLSSCIAPFGAWSHLLFLISAVSVPKMTFGIVLFTLLWVVWCIVVGSVYTHGP